MLGSGKTSKTFKVNIGGVCLFVTPFYKACHDDDVMINTQDGSLVVQE